MSNITVNTTEGVSITVASSGNSTTIAKETANTISVSERSSGTLVAASSPKVISLVSSAPNKTTIASQPANRTIDISGVKATGDKNYVHNQSTPSAIWNISHNLGKRPAVAVVDSADDVVYGDVKYIDDNTVKLTFVGSFSGKAYLN